MDKQIIQVKTMRNSRGHSGLNFRKLSTNKTSIKILQEATLVSASFKRDRVYTVNLAATALTRIFGIRRRRACLGMPTDGGRRNTMWRCTNDRQRGCKMFMGLTTVEKQKIQTLYCEPRAIRTAFCFATTIENSGKLAIRYSRQTLSLSGQKLSSDNVEW